MAKSLKSKLDEPVAVSPEQAMKNLDRMLDQVLAAPVKTVRQRMARAKKQNAAKRARKRP